MGILVNTNFSPVTYIYIDNGKEIRVYSAIHKATSFLVTGHSLQNGKMSMGNRHTERPPDPVLYGSRPSGEFVNGAVKHGSSLINKL